MTNIAARNLLLLNSASVPAPFNPDNIPGLQLWLDGNDPNANGIQPADNTPVSTWFDKSPQGNNFTQVTSGSQPIFTTNVFGSLGSPLFNAALNNFMQLNYNPNLNAQNTTMFVVCNTNQTIIGDAAVMCSRAVDGSSNLFGYTFYEQSTPLAWNPQLGSGAGAWNNTTIENVVTNSQTLLTLNSSGSPTVASTYLNGAFFGSVPYFSESQTSATTPMYVGAGNTNGAPSFYWGGYVNEILIYNASLTSVQQQEVTNYLLKKWGITEAVFNPTFLSGLVTWLDGTDPAATGMPPSVGTQIATWVDKSASANNFTQNMGSAQPTYTSDKGLLMSGSQYMSSIDTATTIGIQSANYQIAVLANTSSSSTQALFSGTSAGSYELIINPTSPSAAALQFNNRNSVTQTSVGTSGAYDNQLTIWGGAGSSESEVQVQSVANGFHSSLQFSTGESLANDNLYIAKRGAIQNVFFNGTVYQVVIYNRLLQSLEQNALFTWLLNQ